MADHFAAIGFLLKRPEDFVRLASRAARVGTAVRAPHGSYVSWSVGHGAELWVQVDEQRQPIGCHPHFAGSSRLRARVTAILPDPGAPMDGSLYATATEAGAAQYPFVVDVPDFNVRVAQLTVPADVTLQVAAFAYELQCFADDGEFLRPGNRVSKLATEAFIPSGLFQPDGRPIHPPQARAIFTGYVRHSEQRSNLFSGRWFQYLTVQSLGGTFDVVADPSVVQGSPVVGGVIFGSFWLSARLA